MFQRLFTQGGPVSVWKHRASLMGHPKNPVAIVCEQWGHIMHSKGLASLPTGMSRMSREGAARASGCLTLVDAWQHTHTQSSPQATNLPTGVCARGGDRG